MSATSLAAAAYVTRGFQTALDQDSATRRRLWRDRKRAWRFLRAGGVIVREEHGGAVGVRWAAASRSGQVFDTPICERWLARARIAVVRDRVASYAWVERAVASLSESGAPLAPSCSARPPARLGAFLG